MKIDYLVPNIFTNFDLQAVRNAGGGMSPNVNARFNALRQYYDVRLISDVDAMKSDFCLVESLWFSLSRDWGEKPHYSQSELHKRHADRMKKFYETPCVKVVTCCELELARIPWWSQAKVKHFPAGVVVNVPYLFPIIEALGIMPIGYLCDAVDPYLFKPAKKEMSVIAVGGLKHIKNPYLIFEVFEKLKDSGMKRIYVGSAEIWSHEARPEDMALTKQIDACTDVWIKNASYVDTAYHLSTAAIGINDTWHDVSSRTNQEMLMSEVISIGGMHPLFDGRPGIHGLKTADEFVEAIREITNDFTEIPVEMGKAGRDWALKNVATDVFLEQFNTIIRNVYL